uniref:Uncharacterized protein n=1 Tax=Heterorhabditis bacteriophora TaxID=37862 RepID=A0A1I7X050_HETBA
MRQLTTRKYGYRSLVSAVGKRTKRKSEIERCAGTMPKNVRSERLTIFVCEVEMSSVRCCYLRRFSVFFVLLPITAAQYPCITCQTNINPGYADSLNIGQSKPESLQNLDLMKLITRPGANVPGFLPSYKGDRYTFASRKEETRVLNQAFFKSLNSTKLLTTPRAESQDDIVITLNSNPTEIPRHTINNNNANTKASVTEFAKYPIHSITLLLDNSDSIHKEPPSEVGRLDLNSDDPSPAYVVEATRALTLALNESNPNFIGPELIIDFDTKYSNYYPPRFNARNNQNQIDPYGSSSLNSVPGYLPDYKGDKYTDPQRIKDTQALNTPFFESIGGAPPAPPLTPAQKGILSERSTFPYSSYQTFRHLQYRNYQKAL